MNDSELGIPVKRPGCSKVTADSSTFGTTGALSSAQPSWSARSVRDTAAMSGALKYSG